MSMSKLRHPIDKRKSENYEAPQLLTRVISVCLYFSLWVKVYNRVFLVAQLGKKPSAGQETWFDPHGVERSSRREGLQPTLVFVPENPLSDRGVWCAEFIPKESTTST